MQAGLQSSPEENLIYDTPIDAVVLFKILSEQVLLMKREGRRAKKKVKEENLSVLLFTSRLQVGCDEEGRKQLMLNIGSGKKKSTTTHSI